MARMDPTKDSCVVVLLAGATFASLLAGGLTALGWWIA
jgi:hypothetical protein